MTGSRRMPSRKKRTTLLAEANGTTRLTSAPLKGDAQKTKVHESSTSVCNVRSTSLAVINRETDDPFHAQAKGNSGFRRGLQLAEIQEVTLMHPTQANL